MKSAMFVGAVFAAFAGAAAAQTCDLEGSVTISYEGKPDSKASAIAYGLPKGEVEKLHRRALRIVDMASRVQDQGGGHMIEFDMSWTCDGTKTKASGVAGVMVQGVTLKGANKVARAAEKEFASQIADEEQRAARGKKRSGGRD